LGREVGGDVWEVGGGEGGVGNNGRRGEMVEEEKEGAGEEREEDGRDGERVGEGNLMVVGMGEWVRVSR
jgi:hypothetical protein